MLLGLSVILFDLVLSLVALLTFGLLVTTKQNVGPDMGPNWLTLMVFFEYCKFGNFREDFIFAKLRICEVL